MIYLAKTPTFVNKLFPRYNWRISKHPKCLYLTFDDGPIPEITPWVLDTLKDFNAKATFFCIGENIINNPNIFKRIIDEGHSVGNHTFNHLNGWHVKNSKYLENVALCNKVVQSKLMRPPYGQIRNTQAKELMKLGYKIIMWDVLSWDFSNKVSYKKCLNNVVNNVQGGSIIVFHDNLKAEKNLKYSLPKCLAQLQRLNYTFEPISLDICH